MEVNDDVVGYWRTPQIQSLPLNNLGCGKLERPLKSLAFYCRKQAPNTFLQQRPSQRAESQTTESQPEALLSPPKREHRVNCSICIHALGKLALVQALVTAVVNTLLSYGHGNGSYPDGTGLVHPEE